MCKGADITANDNYAIKMAAENGYLDIVKHLIEIGLDAGINIVFQHAITGHNMELVKYLVEEGADITADDNFAIQRAVNGHWPPTVKYLLSTLIYPEEYIHKLAPNADNKEIKDLLTNYTTFSYTKACK